MVVTLLQNLQQTVASGAEKPVLSSGKISHAPI